MGSRGSVGEDSPPLCMRGVRLFQLCAQTRLFIESARGVAQPLIWIDQPVIQWKRGETWLTRFLVSNGGLAERRATGSTLGWMAIKAAISSKCAVMPRSKQTLSGLSEAAGKRVFTSWTLFWNAASWRLRIGCTQSLAADRIMRFEQWWTAVVHWFCVRAEDALPVRWSGLEHGPRSSISWLLEEEEEERLSSVEV